MPEVVQIAAFGILHPALALAGLGAALLPVLFHLWNRTHPRKTPWAAMTLLRRAAERHTQRIRIHHLMLLLLRTGAVAAFALAAGRPYLGAEGLLGTAPRHRLVLIDNSFSMNQRVSEFNSAFGRAREVAREIAEQAASGDTVTLITLSEPPELLAAGDRAAALTALDRLAAAVPAASAIHTDAALGLIDEVLTASHHAPRDREILLLSDLCGAEAGLTPLLAERGALRIGHIHAATPDNVALHDFSSSGSVVTAHWPAPFHIRVVNRTSQPVTGARIEFLVDGQPAGMTELDPIEAGSETDVQTDLSFSAAGQYRVQAQLHLREADAMTADNVQWLAVEVVESIHVLVVSDAAEGETAEQRARFIRAALSPHSHPATKSADRSHTNSPFVVRAIHSGQLGNEPLEDYEWVALLDVASLDATQWTRLKRFVSTGRGLFIMAGPRIDVDRYNSFTAASAGPVPVALAGVESPGRETDASVQFLSEPSHHPILSELAGRPDTGFYSTRIFRYLKAQPGRDDAVRVLLRYENGDPALVERAIDAGKVLLLTTSSEMAWSNLPARGDFVSFLLGLGQYLCTDRQSHRRVAGAEPIRLPLDSQESTSSAAITLPDGSIHPLIARAGPNKVVSTTATLPGIYEVQVSGRSRGLELFSRQGEPAESDLTFHLPEASLVSDITHASFAARADVRESELTSLLLGIAFVLLLIETRVALRNRGWRL